MNPAQLAAEYSDMVDRLRAHSGQLYDYNLGRYEDSYAQAIAALTNLVDELQMFR